MTKHDQADELRQLVRQRTRIDATKTRGPQIVAVTSGKGGVGTTTVAINLAVAVALAGRRVVLVDADLDGADMATLCQLETRYTIADVLAGRRGLHEVLERGPAGVQIAAGPWAEEARIDCSPAAQDRLLRELASLGPHADLVVVDIGSGFNRMLRRFWQAADRVLSVVTPDPVTIMDTYAAIKLLAAGIGGTVRALTNHAPDAPVAAQVTDRLARACRRFLGLRVDAAGWLPDDPQVGSAARLGRPFRDAFPDCRASLEIDRVAERWFQESADTTAARHADQVSLRAASPT